MNEVLASVVNSINIYQKTLAEDACIFIADLERVVGCVQGKKIKLDAIKVGVPIEKYENTVTARALRAGKALQEERDATLFGVPYISTATPIYDGDKLVGVIGIIVSNEKIEALRESAVELTGVVEEVSAKTHEIAHASNDISMRVQELSEESTFIKNEIAQINSILSLIQDISTQSNLLGINASIEAARAGDAGRGFSIVANEIRKMSDKSKGSTKSIESQLKHIKESIEKTTNSIQRIVSFTEQHSQTLQELNSSYLHITKTAEKLMEVASKKKYV